MFNSVQSVCNLKYTIKIAFLQQINNFAPENELKIFDIFDVFFQKVDFCRPKPSHHTSHEQNSFFTLQSSECSILLKYFALTNRRSP